MLNKIIPYGHQWIDKNDIQEVAEVLRTDWLTQGPKVEEFEKKISKYCQAKYAVAVSSGTAALHAAYAVAGIKPGDEVITTPLTFAATAYTLTFLGGKPIFVDIEKDTLDIDPQKIEERITKKTKAIAPVDFAGQPCNYEEILKIAKKYKLLVIEDAAQALGAEYQRKKIGSFADFTILSFHPVKTITTGEGGMVLTDNRYFYRKLKNFRHHGIIKKPEKGGWYYEIDNLGHNFRITDFQCALGLSQLKKINKFLKRRREIVAKYNKAFEGIKEIDLPVEKKERKSAWHIYIIQLSLEKLNADRKEIFAVLGREGIGAQVHYLPIHLQPFFKKKFGYKLGDFPIAERYYQKAITLPLFPKMTNRDVKEVIDVVKKTINFYKK